MKITLVESSDETLAPWLIGYLGAEIDRGQAGERRVIPARPNCFIQIVLLGGHAMIDVDSGECVEAPEVGLFGPLTHHRFDMAITGQLRTFCIRLQPAAASRLFGFDPEALVDRFVTLELPEGLIDELRTATTFAAMAGPVDRWLAAVVQGRIDDDPVSLAARQLRANRGIDSIQDLAEGSGLSLRQFQRRFKAITGLNPKHYGRICRIAHAVHLKELLPAASWTGIALECGYSDQSHFIRDFKALTDALPREFLRGQSPLKRHPRWPG